MRKQRFTFFSLFRKSAQVGLIVLLALTLYHLINHFHLPHPLKIASSNATVEIYSNQDHDDLTRLFMQAIAAAKPLPNAIILSIYALVDKHIIHALHQKSEQGIPVHIVCDTKASPNITRYLPKATIVQRSHKGLMHQKILVINHRQILLGSCNLTTSSLKIHGNLVIGMDHPSLALAIEKRVKSMDEDGDVDSSLLHCKTTAGSQSVEFWLLPNNPSAVKRMIALFQTAKKTIRVAMFTWTREDFAQAIIDASKRVNVEVVIDRYSGRGAGSKVVRMLKESGVPVRLSTCQGLLHHKFAYIDDTLVHGSANWTNGAFGINDDYFVIIDPLTSEQQKKMDRIWSIIHKQSAPP